MTRDLRIDDSRARHVRFVSNGLKRRANERLGDLTDTVPRHASYRGFIDERTAGTKGRRAMAMAKRLLFGSILVALAATALLGTPGNAAAEDNGSGLDGWGTKGDFEEFCGLIGGGFIDSPQDNMTICVYPNGDREVCDQNGNDCTIYPKPSAPSNSGGKGPRASQVTAGNVQVVDLQADTDLTPKRTANRASGMVLAERDE
jgi:hypothetical protein